MWVCTVGKGLCIFTITFILPCSRSRAWEPGNEATCSLKSCAPVAFSDPMQQFVVLERDNECACAHNLENGVLRNGQQLQCSGRA